MEFLSILDMKENPEKEKPRQVFLLDLNLYQIIDKINLYWGENLSSMYCCLPADPLCEDYRREVYADIRQEALYSILCSLLDQMKERRELFAKKTEVTLELQKQVWHLQEIACYCGAFRRLARELEALPLKSKGMLAFRAYLRNYVESGRFRDMEKRSGQLLEKMAGFRMKLIYENDRITVLAEETEGTYECFLQNCFPGQNRQMRSPFRTDAGLTELEQELIRAFQKRSPDFFWETEDFYKSYQEYAEDTLIRFSSEIRYYLAFYRFQQKMQEKGFSFATPSLDENRELSARGLYDLALACSRGSGTEQIVSNDMYFGSKESFFVLTGPNQGGKTTFARSLGQLVYFTKMGLDVPASAANVHRFSRILTHFSVEESPDTGRGRLKEELTRLAPMMEAKFHTEAPCFVVINELFTTAANYDACIMGRRVLEHFIAAGCRGIYVTHLADLCQAHPQVVSLRALADEQGRRTFRIRRSTAESTAGADQLAEKHKLTYQQLKERLS